MESRFGETRATASWACFMPMARGRGDSNRVRAQLRFLDQELFAGTVKPAPMTQRIKNE